MKMIIVGCGRMGADLAKLLNQRGQHVTVVDKDPTAFERLGSHFSGRTIAGVGFDRDVLLKAEIEHVDGLAAVTSSDEANVVTAQVARQVFHVPKVVARLYDPRQTEIYHRLGLETISPLDWGTQRIADLLLHSQLNVVLSLGSGETEIVEVAVPQQWVGRSMKDIDIPSELMVIAYTRRSHAYVANLGMVFEEHDIVHICVVRSAVDRLNKMLGLN